MKIYTKTGDRGQTMLFGGGRVPKHHIRVQAYGAIDELNALLGVARACQPSRQGDDLLRQVQGQLFRLGADLATPLDAKADWLSRIDAGHVSWLEATIDQMTAELAPLKHFILPGGAPAAAQLHVARTVCRRAERLIVALAAAHDIGEPVIAYVNRLSDWLFTLSRWENAKAGASEEKWRPRG